MARFTADQERADTTPTQRNVQVTGNPLIALTDKQRLFVDNLLRGTTQTTAARLAGYSDPGPEAVRQLKNEKVVAAIQYLHRKHEKASQMSRKKVMDGFREAIEMAKLQGEPGVMVNGWREIGRMCGYYAAEKKQIDVNITAKRAVEKLETMSDAELLEMAENDTALIEGEFSEVLDTIQEAADAAYEDEDDD